MPRALVVDDEAKIRDLVSVYLTAAGFEVEQAADGPSALEVALAETYDVIILDIMLPGIDGAEVCRSIRKRSAVPIIMLTARADELEKIAFLEAGADDYVTKPFSPPELVARVRAVIRRTARGQGAEDVHVLGALWLDTSQREVKVDGRGVVLTAKEFDLLATMLRDPGVVFSRERLLEAVWGFSDFVDLRGVDVHIRHLREKLGDDASSPRFIETVRGVGYRVRKDGG
ncbi:MAG: response regulator transcription factor [Coriobacteriia bacterium]|nr:response regulator transcription factor [Coriobacteriia bacterium]